MNCCTLVIYLLNKYYSQVFWQFWNTNCSILTFNPEKFDWEGKAVSIEVEVAGGSSAD
jgi:hypothetical protein